MTVFRIAGLASITVAISATIASAQQVNISSSNVSAVPTEGMSKVMLTVTGPDGYYRQEFSPAGAASIAMGGMTKLPDGLYTYLVTGATNKTQAADTKFDNGRGPNQRKTVQVGASVIGSFTVVNGAIVQDNGKAEE